MHFKCSLLYIYECYTYIHLNEDCTNCFDHHVNYTFTDMVLRYMIIMYTKHDDCICRHQFTDRHYDYDDYDYIKVMLRDFTHINNSCVHSHNGLRDVFVTIHFIMRLCIHCYCNTLHTYSNIIRYIRIPVIRTYEFLHCYICHTATYINNYLIRHPTHIYVLVFKMLEIW